MPKTLAFQDLWNMAVAASNAHNGLAYHPCCDSWTTRASKTKRKSHRQKLQWRELLATLDRDAEDKKQALLVKMTEEGWRIPALLNQSCSARSRSSIGVQTLFQHHHQVIPPEQLPEPILGPDNPYLPSLSVSGMDQGIIFSQYRFQGTTIIFWSKNSTDLLFATIQPGHLVRVLLSHPVCPRS